MRRRLGVAAAVFGFAAIAAGQTGNAPDWRFVWTDGAAQAAGPDDTGYHAMTAGEHLRTGTMVKLAAGDRSCLLKPASGVWLLAGENTDFTLLPPGAAGQPRIRLEHGTLLAVVERVSLRTPDIQIEAASRTITVSDGSVVVSAEPHTPGALLLFRGGIHLHSDDADEPGLHPKAPLLGMIFGKTVTEARTMADFGRSDQQELAEAGTIAIRALTAATKVHLPGIPAKRLGIALEAIRTLGFRLPRDDDVAAWHTLFNTVDWEWQRRGGEPLPLPPVLPLPSGHPLGW